MDVMLAGMTSTQLQEWLIYARLNPFDETRADQRAASIVHILRNAHRKRGSATVKFDDCVLRFGDNARPKMDWRHMKAIGKAMTMQSWEES